MNIFGWMLCYFVADFFLDFLTQRQLSCSSGCRTRGWQRVIPAPSWPVSLWGQKVSPQQTFNLPCCLHSQPNVPQATRPRRAQIRSSELISYASILNFPVWKKVFKIFTIKKEKKDSKKKIFRNFIPFFDILKY